MAKRYEIIVERDASRISLEIAQIVPALPAIIAAPDAAVRAETAAAGVEASAEMARIWAESDVPPDPEDLSRKSSKSWAMDAAAAVGSGTVSALAALASQADMLPYFDGVGSMAQTPFTGAARALLDDVDAAEMRGTLGLATGATTAVVTSATDTTAGRLVTTGAGPAQAFRRGNIIGTVSQSAGVPTGAVIERGSNANGEYVRFADGTQMCTQVVDSLPRAAATGFFRTIAFAATFVVPPTVSLTLGPAVDYDNAYMGPIRVSAVSNTQCSITALRGFGAPDVPVGATLTSVHVIAMGRWF